MRRRETVKTVSRREAMSGNQCEEGERFTDAAEIETKSAKVPRIGGSRRKGGGKIGWGRWCGGGGGGVGRLVKRGGSGKGLPRTHAFCSRHG